LNLWHRDTPPTRGWGGMPHGRSIFFMGHGGSITITSYCPVGSTASFATLENVRQFRPLVAVVTNYLDKQ
jgi:hypothetical protein